MKIGFLLSTDTAIGSAGNGIRAQALFQAKALERVGHEVVYLEPWNLVDCRALDAVQFFQGGYPFMWIEHSRPSRVRNLVFAPIIDSNEPQWRYRLAARIGTLHPRLQTIPGVLRQQAMGSNLVIVRSKHERERIISGLGVDPGRTPVEIVLNGVDPPQHVDPAPARRAFGLPREFLLHVGLYTQGRKNVARMIQAVGPTGLPLIIAGSPVEGPELTEIRQLAERFGNVRLMGFLDRELLFSMYAACKVFCLPSIHEGTGLVALEAAACGAGVVITERGGPPDYFGKWAQYVNPYSVESIRTAVLAAWENPHSEEIRRHVVSNLTWDQSVASLIQAYQRHLK